MFESVFIDWFIGLVFETLAILFVLTATLLLHSCVDNFAQMHVVFMTYLLYVRIYSDNYGCKQLRFDNRCEFPEMLEKLRKTCRKSPALISCLKDFMVPMPM